MRKKEKKHLGFDRLAAEIAKGYERKGYSKKRATEWGIETAGKVWHEKLYKRHKR